MTKLAVEDLSILLLEPSVTQRKIIESRLAEAGNHNVEGVSTADAALAAMRTMAPDLVISSMYLDDMTGSDLVTKMRSDDQLKDVLFMLISSEEDVARLDPIKQAGVVAILSKPFAVDDLRKALFATAEYIDPEELDAGYLDAEQVRVLIVDDSSTARNHINRLLIGMGMEDITMAQDGTEAVEILENKTFDLVITDYNMPEMDGESLTQHIRNHSDQANVPILLLTSEADKSRLDAIRSSGVSAICDKPFTASDITQILTQLLS